MVTVMGQSFVFYNPLIFSVCVNRRVVEFGVVLTRYKCYEVTSHSSILACAVLSYRLYSTSTPPGMFSLTAS